LQVLWFILFLWVSTIPPTQLPTKFSLRNFLPNHKNQFTKNKLDSVIDFWFSARAGSPHKTQTTSPKAKNNSPSENSEKYTTIGVIYASRAANTVLQATVFFLL